MITEDTSTLDIVVLIVFVQAMNAFWSADSPYNGALEMSPDTLKRYLKGASAQTILIGIAASFLSKRVLPAFLSILIALGFVGWYQYEYNRIKFGTFFGRSRGSELDEESRIASEFSESYGTS